MCCIKSISNSTGKNKKPEIITTHSTSSGGVDTSDWMTKNYSVARKSARWPFTVFNALLNIGGMNPQITDGGKHRNKITHLRFLRTLGPRPRRRPPITGIEL